MSKQNPKDYKTAQKLRDTKQKGYTPPRRKQLATLENYKPLSVVDSRTNRLVALFVFLAAVIVYMLTQARTMSFWDSGEYATCGSILGIPHPPGNPMHIILSRAFCAIAGNLFPHAVIVAFISGLFSALGVMLTYLITVKLVSMIEEHKWLVVGAGVLAALYTAFAFTHWTTSIEAEVNSGMLFFVNLTLWLTLAWVEKSKDFSHQNILLLIVYAFFLGFCVHQTALQTVPSVMFIILYPYISKAVKEGRFWIRMLIYAVILLAVYFITDPIGRSIKFNDFNKWMFMVSAAILLYLNYKDLISTKVWVFGLILAGIGLSPHVFLLIRSAARPFINEGYPHNWQLFMDYILRRQYGEVSFTVRRAALDYQFGFHFLRYFGWQWFNAETLSGWTRLPQAVFAVIGNIIAVGFGVFGFVNLARRNKHAFIYYLSVLIMTTVIFVFVLNLSSGEVRDRDYFFVSAFNMWAIAMGIGCIYLIRQLMRLNKVLLYLGVAVIMLLPIVNLASQYKVHDRSKEYIAVDYGMNFLNSVEENAIIFTNGDNDTFPLWYCQAVFDPAVRENKYPAKEVTLTPESRKAIDSAMQFKNGALKGIRKDVTIANLSLLNTPWYIRQLRDREGVLFDWPDNVIDGLHYIPMTQYEDVYASVSSLLKNTARSGEGFSVEITSPDSTQNFTVSFPNYPMWRNEGIFRVSDLSVIKIIQDNFGKRPIYFAVTCETNVGFDKNLRNEGMVSRIVPVSAERNLDIARLLNNTEKVYSYRSIHDARVYKDENMRRLMMNYGAAYDRAYNHFLDKGDYRKAQHYLDKAFEFISQEYTKDLRLLQLYLASGQKELAVSTTRRILAQQTFEPESYAQIAYTWYRSDPEMAFEVLQEAVKKYPSDYDVAYTVYDFGKMTMQFSRAKNLMNQMDAGIRPALQPYMDSLGMFGQYYQAQTPEQLDKP